MAAAAKHLASVTLELGGKSPSIVDETANLKTAAQQIAWGKYLNNGQTCIAPDYVLVHSSVKEPFLAEFRQAVRQMYNAGDQGVEASDSYARMVNSRHFQRVRTLLDDAVSAGARVTMGGQMDSEHNFIEPTVVEGVTDDMRIMQEEIFGPVTCIFPFDDVEDVLAKANGTEYGLAASVWTNNLKVGLDLAHRLEAGLVQINQNLVVQANLSYGGVKSSGLGKEASLEAMLEHFMHKKTIMVNYA